MSPELHQLILTYGYWLMMFGALIEGETFLVSGGVAAQQGLLHLPGLIIVAIVGSLIHDCFFFFLGRYAGHKILEKKPQFKAKSKAVLNLLDKYGVFLIIAFRFAYGLRTIIPTALGMSEISNKKFIFFDLIGGIIWSCTFVLGGYFLGEAITRILKTVGVYEHLVGKIVVISVFAVLIIGFLRWLFRICQSKKKLKKQKEKDL